MPRAAAELPSLLGRIFTVERALADGVSPARLRAGDLDRSVWGARMPAGGGVAARARALLLACPGTFLCGPTAARVHGIPLPWRCTPETRDEIDLGIAAPGRAIRRRGVRSRSVRVRADDLVERDGLRFVALERCWCELASWCSVPELVAAADWVLRSGGSTIERLSAAIDSRFDRAGSEKLRVALGLADAAAESPKESEIRALIVLAGLPAPAVNVEVTDEHGRFVARVDLLFKAYGEILEYQGDHHRTDVRQWRRDRSRESELESLGLHVTEVTAADLSAPLAMIGRIARNLERRGWKGEPRLSPWFPGVARRRSSG